ncbi:MULTISPECIES: hypothetical protein [Streptomyces]|uniref:hypothetical protein n=1 Tax=Streptomyces TaxID=1883 RepID=UPI00068AA7CD|nr:MULTISPECIES: hypothetical protein [Streptomyces]
MPPANSHTIPLDEHTALRATFDPALRCYGVQLWIDGEPHGIHGLAETLRSPREALAGIDQFLDKHGERRLRQGEVATLAATLDRLGYPGLSRSSGIHEWTADTLW